MAEVYVQDGETLESALRRFKRKVQQEDIIQEIKRRRFYLKPGQKKRIKSALACFPISATSTRLSPTADPMALTKSAPAPMLVTSMKIWPGYRLVRRSYITRAYPAVSSRR